MLDSEPDQRHWLQRLVQVAVALAIALVVVWLFVNRQRFSPKKPLTPHEQVTTLRDHSQRPSARRFAADALENADASVVPDLIVELKGGDDLGREFAALALGRLGDRAGLATDALKDAVNDPVVHVRLQVTVALGRITSQPDAAIAGLLVSIRDDERDVRKAAFTALRRQHAAGELTGLLTDADADVRRRAAIALGYMGSEADEFLDKLRATMADSDPRVRAEVVAALANRGALDPAALIAAIHDDPDPLVRRTALGLLTKELHEAAMPRAPNNGHRDPRSAVMEWIGKLGAQAEPAILVIASLLDDPDEALAKHAAVELGMIGPPAQAATEALLAHLQDQREGVRVFSISALDKIGLESQLRPPELFRALEANGDRVRSLILWTRSSREQEGYGITDADMRHLSTLKNLLLLELRFNPVGDAGLAHLANLSELKRLDLAETNITSAGLAHLSRLSNLEWLYLNRCEIDDDGLQYLKDLHALKHLGLYGTRVTDAGLSHLKELTSLEQIQGQFSVHALAQLPGLTTIDGLPKSTSDDDLALLASFTRLRELDLRGTSITDAGLTSLAEITPLETLSLSETAISDAGLAHLKGLPKLRFLSVNQTRVTQAGADDFANALPDVQIYPFAPGKSSGDSPQTRPYEVVGLKRNLDWP